MKCQLVLSCFRDGNRVGGCVVGIVQLGSLLLVALDVADQRCDFGRATSIMVLSQTYYVLADMRGDKRLGGAADGTISSASGGIQLLLCTTAPWPPYCLDVMSHVVQVVSELRVTTCKTTTQTQQAPSVWAAALPCLWLVVGLQVP